MAIYAVGDVQGCFLTFQKLLDEISFDAQSDQLILLGDVINRGPKSLEMLRFIRKNHRSVKMVLGNHEIFAIALYLNAVKDDHGHTLFSLLGAPDREELFSFLRAQPLMLLRDGAVFVHAGILPAISIADAHKNADDLSEILIGPRAKTFLTDFFKKIPSRFEPMAGPKQRLHLALAYLCFIRMCKSSDEMALDYVGPPREAPRGLKEWFALRDDEDIRCYFGHWAALGLFSVNGYYCLDTGCAWGNALTAIRLDDHQIFQINNQENQ